MARTSHSLGTLGLILCWAGALCFGLGSLANLPRLVRDFSSLTSSVFFERPGYFVGELLIPIAGIFCILELRDHYNARRSEER